MTSSAPRLATARVSLCIAIVLASAPAFAANSPPEVDEASFDTDEDKPLVTTVKARDQEGDALSFKITKGPKNGEASIAADGKLSYTRSEERRVGKEWRSGWRP